MPSLLGIPYLRLSGGRILDISVALMMVQARQDCGDAEIENIK